MKKSRKTNVVEPIRDKNDIQRIIDYLNKNDKRKYAVLFILGINSGLRVSDLLGFKVKDVLNQSSIKLREQKTGKYKLFPLKDELQEMLNEFCKNRNPNEWLFVGKSNKKLDRIIVYKTFVNACKELKINASVGTHTMRKTFGYHHYKQFNNIVLLQTIFNHYSPVVTKRYIGITQDEINESYLNLNLKPPKDNVNDAKLTSRIRARRIKSYCNNYLKNGGKIHKNFALDILDLLN
jgi:integrase